MRHIFPWLVGAFAFFALAATSPMLPLVWDEGELINRAALVKRWSGQAIDHLRGNKKEPSPFS
ncbi:MAG: hypothetical protein FWH27_19410, partial [Planctomycetaceae bacterium]|nr:hypothetical protein [Planctomycetaceae bacterium]